MKLTIVALCAGLAFAGPEGAPMRLRGTVLETLDAGDYTYVRVDAPEGGRWAAIPKAALKSGETVEIEGATVMENFQSRLLGRKFDRVLFGVLAAPGVAAPVAKAEGSEGRTIAEVFARKGELKGKQVVVRAKVVKYNAKIMGTNWIHLRDGTGSDKRKDNDLAVTTPDAVAVGDVIIVRGTVAVDKDLGAGYFYPVLLEQARVVKP